MILTVNAELVNVLEEGLNREKLSLTVAKAFCKMEAFFRIYTGNYIVILYIHICLTYICVVYCNGYDNAVSRVIKCSSENKR